MLSFSRHFFLLDDAGNDVSNCLYSPLTTHMHCIMQKAMTPRSECVTLPPLRNQHTERKLMQI